jgi:hypothetical protein
MFQPEVKLEFIRRYCQPTNGWEIFVDIDASEDNIPVILILTNNQYNAHLY